MNEHQRCIELAAASIDFPLSPDEQRSLRTHLALCDSCTVTVRGLRDDAMRLAAAPHLTAPVAVRNAVIADPGGAVFTASRFYPERLEQYREQATA